MYKSEGAFEGLPLPTPKGKQFFLAWMLCCCVLHCVVLFDCFFLPKICLWCCLEKVETSPDCYSKKYFQTTMWFWYKVKCVQMKITELILSEMKWTVTYLPFFQMIHFVRTSHTLGRSMTSKYFQRNFMDLSSELDLSIEPCTYMYTNRAVF